MNVMLVNFPNTTIPANNNFTYVLMLHGFPESSSLAFNEVFNYSQSLPTVTKKNHYISKFFFYFLASQEWLYIVPDLLGSGNSSAPTDVSAYNLTTMATYISFVTNFAAGGKPTHVVGVDLYEKFFLFFFF